MEMHFYKYQGTGNDFIIVDDRVEKFDITNNFLIERLCHRRFGIGADGFILLRSHPDFDFEMIYFNSDGRQSSMCGNGGRCIIAFAHFLKVIDEKCRFLAIDGPHEGSTDDTGKVSLKMIDVDSVENLPPNQCFLNTGSPHIVEFRQDALNEIDIIPTARAIRYNERFKAEGTNVNFVKVSENTLDVRTYERGVEDETYSCGTGVTAVALAAHFQQKVSKEQVYIKTKGGDLEVSFEHQNGAYRNIWLSGPAEQVFSGTIDLKTIK